MWIDFKKTAKLRITKPEYTSRRKEPPIYASRTPCCPDKTQPQSNLHSQKKPLITVNIQIASPQVQRNKLEADPAETLEECRAVSFFDGAVNADDDLGDGEDNFSEFDKCHESVICEKEYWYERGKDAHPCFKSLPITSESKNANRDLLSPFPPTKPRKLQPPA